jgi:hypothetical protein
MPKLEKKRARDSNTTAVMVDGATSTSSIARAAELPKKSIP